KYLVSRGSHPFWSPDGKELFYNPGPARSVDVVRLTTQPSFTFGKPEAVPGIVGFRLRPPNSETEISMTRDGAQFVGIVAAGSTRSGALAFPPIEVVINWGEELKQRVPTK